ncbi:MAG TPA: stage II sporulation protein M [Actinomycetota bacterium]|nr:stage II sporulation protein M [Actinomycetota bacterium]
MDIDSFIQHYRPEWDRLEQACAKGRAGLSRLSGPEIDDVVRLYLRASAQLAEVRTRHRDPRLEAYLNRLVTTAHNALYGSRVTSVRDALRLLGVRYQEAARRTLPYIVVCAVITVVLAAATQLWVAGSRSVRAGILPGVSRQALQHGHHAVNLGAPAPDISGFIFVHNVQVAVLSFIVGIALCGVTLYLVALQAVNLGTLSGTFQALGYSGRFWSLILPHGLLELSAICIAAGAGLRMGWAIIAPGDRTRADALTAEALDAVLVVLGVVPAFALAALIEGFVTPSGINPAISITLGVVVATGYLTLLFGTRRHKIRPPASEKVPAVATATAGPGF